VLSGDEDGDAIENVPVPKCNGRGPGVSVRRLGGVPRAGVGGCCWVEGELIVGVCGVKERVMQVLAK
jgi:hypothetical protein